MNLSSCLSSSGDMGYTLQFNAAGASGFKTMAWSYAPCCGILFDSASEKIKACQWYSLGTISSQVLSFLSVAASASCCATVVLATFSVTGARLRLLLVVEEDDVREVIPIGEGQ